jgi:hypothetical protein
MLSLRSVIPAHAGIQVCSGRISLDTRFRGYDGPTQPLVVLIFAQIFFEGAREGLGQSDQRNRMKRLAIISLALLVSTVAARPDRVRMSISAIDVSFLPEDPECTIAVFRAQA